MIHLLILSLVCIGNTVNCTIQTRSLLSHHHSKPTIEEIIKQCECISVAETIQDGMLILSGYDKHGTCMFDKLGLKIPMDINQVANVYAVQEYLTQYLNQCGFKINPISKTGQIQNGTVYNMYRHIKLPTIDDILSNAQNDAVIKQCDFIDVCITSNSNVILSGYYRGDIVFDNVLIKNPVGEEIRKTIIIECLSNYFTKKK
eukprot:219435_1